MICYKITHRESGKAYVGSTTRSLKLRWWEHCKAKTAIGLALKKHGATEFDLEVLASARSHADLLATETALIAQENTVAPNGYNIARDGRGPMYGRHHTLEAKEKLRRANSGENCWNFGKTLSEETKKKLSESCKAALGSGPAHPSFGHKKSPALLAAMSAQNSGPLNPNYGKRASDETRRKLSEAHKGRSPTPETRAKLAAATKASWERGRAILTTGPGKAQ